MFIHYNQQVSFKSYICSITFLSNITHLTHLYRLFLLCYSETIQCKDAEMTYTKEYAINERYSMPNPNGWYAVCYSKEVLTTKIKTVSMLDKEFVVFRSRKGKVNVLEAYCPHQGTHLGYGGEIVEDCIVCPFHRWHFNGEGTCVKIPYATKLPALERNCLNSLPTHESEGMVYCYYHADNKKPDFKLADFDSEFPEADWTPPVRAEFTIKTHVHEFGENGFDIAHFKPVHGSEDNKIIVNSDPSAKEMKYRLSLVYPGSGMGLPMIKIAVCTDWTYHGLGVFSNLVTLEKFPIIIRQVYCFTPQNNGETLIRFFMRIKRNSLAKNTVLKWLQTKLIHFQNVKLVLRNFNEDKAIWENKRYRAKPVLCDGDGPIMVYRRWAQQFYSAQGPLDTN